MIKLYDNGVYLLNGKELVEDKAGVQAPISKEEAAKNTMAYSHREIWRICRSNLIS